MGRNYTGTVISFHQGGGTVRSDTGEVFDFSFERQTERLRREGEFIVGSRFLQKGERKWIRKGQEIQFRVQNATVSWWTPLFSGDGLVQVFKGSGRKVFERPLKELLHKLALGHFTDSRYTFCRQVAKGKWEEFSPMDYLKAA